VSWRTDELWSKGIKESWLERKREHIRISWHNSRRPESPALPQFQAEQIKHTHRVLILKLYSGGQRLSRVTMPFLLRRERPGDAVKYAKLHSRNREFLCSDLFSGTSNLDWNISSYSSIPPGKHRVQPQIKTTVSPSTPDPILYSLIILQLNAIKFTILTHR
jgi:hypothetical protein